ncbi:hypothetical protein COO60DRAFT_1551065, partial [Scenedesmus sp. NREL 46B-D3]
MLLHLDSTSAVLGLAMRSAPCSQLCACGAGAPYAQRYVRHWRSSSTVSHHEACDGSVEPAPHTCGAHQVSTSIKLQQRLKQEGIGVHGGVGGMMSKHVFSAACVMLCSSGTGFQCCCNAEGLAAPPSRTRFFRYSAMIRSCALLRVCVKPCMLFWLSAMGSNRGRRLVQLVGLR